MAISSSSAPSAPGMDVGRIQDFVDGMESAHDQDTKAVLKATAWYGAGLAYKALRQRGII